MTVAYKDTTVGMEIGPLVKHITPRRLAMWAGLTREFSERHYDKDFAQKMEGLPEPIMHGAYLSSFPQQLLLKWAGEKATLKKSMSSFRHAHLLSEDIVCKGKVIQKYIKDGENLVECEVWIENPAGQRTTTGLATLDFLD
jgi:hypothetical protein